MRILCDHCSTRYSIADEKVRGKLVKIRCKKCQHTILVRSDDEITDVAPKLVGERNDASQLFSLDQLQSIAVQPRQALRPSVTSGEGSGLIDIQAMARLALATSPPEDPGATAVPTFSPALSMPILMPRPAPMPAWIWAVVIASVLALSGTVLAVLTRRPAPAVPIAQPHLPPRTTPQPVVTPLAHAELVAQAPRSPIEPPASPPRPVSRAASRTPAVRRSVGQLAPVAPVAPPPKSAPDELTALLEQASHDDAPVQRAPAPSEAELPDHLGRTELTRGFQSVQPRIETCFAQADARGPVMVALVIAPDGAVSSAEVRGALAGSATGDCIARAARAASFQRFRGSALSITYAFIRHGRP